MIVTYYIICVVGFIIYCWMKPVAGSRIRIANDRCSDQQRDFQSDRRGVSAYANNDLAIPLDPEYPTTLNSVPVFASIQIETTNSPKIKIGPMTHRTIQGKNHLYSASQIRSDSQRANTASAVRSLA